MKGKIAYPFLTLSDSSLQAGKWQIFVGDGGAIAEDDHIPNWDYMMPLRIKRTIELDPDVIAQRLDIRPKSLKVDLVVRLGTGPGVFPRIIETLNHRITGRFVEIDHSLGSNALSRRLKLNTSIVLASPPEECGPLSPRLAGTRLWADAVDYRLEGEEPRFPMEAVKFSEHFRDNIAAGSLWYLHWNPLELDRDFHGGVRVYLNADYPEFIKRINAGDRETLQLILGGVISQMAERAMSEPGGEEHLQAAAPGSTAWHIRAWLLAAFPTEPFELMKSTLDHKPGKFHSAIQALTDVVGGPQ